MQLEGGVGTTKLANAVASRGERVRTDACLGGGERELNALSMH